MQRPEGNSEERGGDKKSFNRRWALMDAMILEHECLRKTLRRDAATTLGTLIPLPQIIPDTRQKCILEVAGWCAAAIASPS